MDDHEKGPGLDPELFGALKFYSTLSLDLAISSFSGFALGRMLDRLYQTTPVCAACGFLLGASSGFYSIYKLVTREARRDSLKKRKKRRTGHE
ncbi:MAG TPA: AtpZ/AtpI family protein [Bacillota bacterium]